MELSLVMHVPSGPRANWLCIGWQFCLAEMRREFQTGGIFFCTTLYTDTKTTRLISNINMLFSTKKKQTLQAPPFQQAAAVKTIRPPLSHLPQKNRCSPHLPPIHASTNFKAKQTDGTRKSGGGIGVKIKPTVSLDICDASGSVNHKYFMAKFYIDTNVITKHCQVITEFRYPTLTRPLPRSVDDVRNQHNSDLKEVVFNKKSC